MVGIEYGGLAVAESGGSACALIRCLSRSPFPDHVLGRYYGVTSVTLVDADNCDIVVSHRVAAAWIIYAARRLASHW